MVHLYVYIALAVAAALILGAVISVKRRSGVSIAAGVIILLGLFIALLAVNESRMSWPGP